MAAICTPHIQRLLTQALELAKEVDGLEPGATTEGQLVRPGPVTAIEMISRAVNLAEHAAAELRDEAFTSTGWPV